MASERILKARLSPALGMFHKSRFLAGLVWFGLVWQCGAGERLAYTLYSYIVLYDSSRYLQMPLDTPSGESLLMVKKQIQVLNILCSCISSSLAPT